MAAITGLWLVVCGVLALHHDGEVAHVRDAHGQLVHTSRLTGHHVANQHSDIHGQRDPDADHGICGLSDVVHAAAPASRRPPVIQLEPIALAAASRPAETAPARTIYRDAPKTSPPRV